MKKLMSITLATLIAGLLLVACPQNVKKGAKTVAHKEESITVTLASDAPFKIGYATIDKKPLTCVNGTLPETPGTVMVTPKKGAKEVTFKTHLGNLEGFQIRDVGITAIKIVGCTNLGDLDLAGNALTELNLPALPALATLTLNQNRFETLTLSDLPALTALDIYVLFNTSSPLQTLTLKNLPLLTKARLNNNNLSSITLTNVPKLNSLDVSTNRLDAAAMTKLLNELPDITASGFAGTNYITYYNGSALDEQNVADLTTLDTLKDAKEKAEAKGWEFLSI